MSSAYRRFEILLPRQFNDGRPVPEKLFADAIWELRQRFGAVSSETQIIRGVWQYQGEIYRDELIRLFVDVEDTDDNRRFMLGFKTRVKESFGQLDIWLTSHPIEVL